MDEDKNSEAIAEVTAAPEETEVVAEEVVKEVDIDTAVKEGLMAKPADHIVMNGNIVPDPSQSEEGVNSRYQ